MGKIIQITKRVVRRNNYRAPNVWAMNRR
jgi:hypothetical protein